MGKKIQISNEINVLLAAFPFFLFLIIHLIYYDFIVFFLNNFLPFLFIFSTLIVLMFGGHKYDFFYSWLGFSIYFYSVFVFPSRLGLKWISRNVLVFYDHINYNYSFLIFKHSGTYYLLFINLILFLLLFKVFKISLKKIFILIFTYYFSYCSFQIANYHLNPSGTEIGLKSISVFYIINSIISILFLIFLLLPKKKISEKSLFIYYLIFNFMSINLLEFNQIIVNFIDYIKSFIVQSDMIFYLIFLQILRLFKNWKDKKKAENLVARQ